MAFVVLAGTNWRMRIATSLGSAMVAGVSPRPARWSAFGATSATSICAITASKQRWTNTKSNRRLLIGLQAVPAQLRACLSQSTTCSRAHMKIACRCLSSRQHFHGGCRHLPSHRSRHEHPQPTQRDQTFIPLHRQLRQGRAGCPIRKAVDHTRSRLRRCVMIQ